MRFGSTRFSSLRSYGAESVVGRLSIWSIYFSALAIQLEYAILMPSVWSYIQSVGGSKFMLGLSISAFSVARLLLFFVIGFWLDRRGYREPYVFCYICGIIGNFMYGFAGKAGTAVLIITGRLIVGLGAANQTLSEAYISQVTSDRKRTKKLAVLQGIQIIGLVAGPALNILFAASNWKLGIIEFNVMTAPGYAMVLLNVICLVSTIAFIVEPHDFEHSSQLKSSVVRNCSEFESMVAPPLSERPCSNTVTALEDLEDEGFLINFDSTLSSIKDELLEESKSYNFYEHFWEILFVRGGIFIWTVKFTIGFEISALETALTPITEQQYQWNSFENSVAFAGLAVASLIGVFATIVLNKFGSSARFLIAVGNILLGLAFIILLGFCSMETVGMIPLLLAAALIVMSLPVLNASSTTIYSRMIKNEPAGVWFGYSQIAFVLGKILGPILTGYFLTHYNVHYPLFLSISLTFLVSLVVLGVYWKTLALYVRVK